VTVVASAPTLPAPNHQRLSGKPLSDGVPGMFTYDGYHKRFQDQVTVLSGVMAAEEPWVLGTERGTADRVKDAANLGALTDRVRRLYLEEYNKQWDALLADVKLVRATGIEKSIETARILSGAASPLANFLRAVVKETTLIPAEVRSVGDFDPAFAAMLRERPDALLVSNDPFHQLHIGRIMEFRYITMRARKFQDCCSHAVAGRHLPAEHNVSR